MDILKSNRGALATLLFLSFVYFLENFNRYLIAVSPIPYIDYSSYEYSVLAGPAFTVVYTLSGLFFSLIQTDAQTCCHLSKITILAIATFLFSASFTATAVAKSFYQQMLIRVAMGITQSVITPFSTSIISDSFDSRVRGTAFAIFNVGTYIAFSLSLSLGTYMYVRFGWQAGYLLFGLLGMVCAAAMPLLVCVNKRQQQQQAGGPDRPNTVTDGESSTYAKPPHEVRYTAVDCIEIEGETGEITVSDSVLPAVQSPLVAAESQGSGASDNAAEQSSGGSDKRFSLPGQGVRPTMYEALREVLWEHWGARPEVYLVCLATGVRLGGGYIWTAYTSAFFSDLFASEDPARTCAYSYNAAVQTSAGGVCGSDFPYCVGGGSHCAALTSFPWHNQGMSPARLEMFMAWVPLVGSGAGSLLGGLLSDYLVQRGKGGGAVAVGDSGKEDTAMFPDESGRHSPAERPLLLPSCDLTGSPAADCPDGGGSVRMLVAGVGTLLSLPLVLASLALGYPHCFLVMVASGLVGEAYLSQALAVVADARTVPLRLVTQSVAVFMLLVTIVGGNVPLLVPYLLTTVGFSADVTLRFQAAPMVAADAHAALMASTAETEFAVQHTNAWQLQASMMCLLGATYGLSGLLYVLCSVWMRRKVALRLQTS